MKENCLHPMAKYVLIIALLPVCWAALETAGGTKSKATMVLQVKLPPSQIIIQDPNCIGTIQFDLYGINGKPVGQAIACIKSETFPSTSMRDWTAHFTFSLANGQ